MTLHIDIIITVCKQRKHYVGFYAASIKKNGEVTLEYDLISPCPTEEEAMASAVAEAMEKAKASGLEGITETIIKLI